jgi:hypothetical protein
MVMEVRDSALCYNGQVADVMLDQAVAPACESGPDQNQPYQASANLHLQLLRGGDLRVALSKDKSGEFRWYNKSVLHLHLFTFLLNDLLCTSCCLPGCHMRTKQAASHLLTRGKAHVATRAQPSFRGGCVTWQQGPGRRRPAGAGQGQADCAGCGARPGLPALPARGPPGPEVAQRCTSLLTTANQPPTNLLSKFIYVTVSS